MNITITLILDKGKNQYIRGKMGVKKVTKEINQCQEKWLKHVQRMDTNRLPKQALQYKRKGRRNIRRPRKRWRDQLHLEKKVQGKVATTCTGWTQTDCQNNCHLQGKHFLTTVNLHFPLLQ